MKIKQASTSTKKWKEGGNKPLKFPYQCPETLDEAVEMWGSEVVLAKAIARVVMDLQREVREKMEIEKDGIFLSPQEIIASMKGWKPSIPRSKKSPLQNMVDFIAGLPPARKAEAVRILQEKLTAKRAAEKASTPAENEDRPR